MCGIVGYIGTRQAQPILIKGLEKLEYRGYDSAGISVMDNGKISVRKVKGKLENLKRLLEEAPCGGTIGIGHTRWATHGEPLDVNSHPHLDMAGEIAVVHNGIIENYIELKEWLIKEKHCEFVSQTDTEVVAHMLSVYYDGDMLSTITRVLPKLKGSYALGIISMKDQGKLFCARKDSPLVIGRAEHGMMIASDIPAILDHTRDVLMLENDEIGVLTVDSAQVFDVNGEMCSKEIQHIDWNIETAEKGGYPHFMLKEIYEQPKVYAQTLSPLIKKEGGLTRFRRDTLPFTEDELKRFKQIRIIACGTAYHAGLVGRDVLREMLKIPVDAEIASEFRYNHPIILPDTLFIIISQSGETADTIAAMKEARKFGGVVLAITNVVGSTVAREADKVIYTMAGLEIAVASTKAYTAQLMVLYAFTAIMAQCRGVITEERASEFFEKLEKIPDYASKVLECAGEVWECAKKVYGRGSIFFIGRGLDYSLAMEGSLKLKEISYIHSEAYAAGELKHGTIALIEKGTPVVAIATQKRLVEKTVSNMEEVRVRGARILAITYQGNSTVSKVADTTFYIPNVDDMLTPMLSIIPMQLFAYYTALEKGCDIDKPRNLAKSVTVE